MLLFLRKLRHVDEEEGISNPFDELTRTRTLLSQAVGCPHLVTESDMPLPDARQPLGLNDSAILQAIILDLSKPINCYINVQTYQQASS